MVLSKFRDILLTRRRAVLFAGVLSFCGSVFFGAIRGYPRPEIHDEFSYLLAADTFASGRLANPSPPHWSSFESFHILVEPKYVSKYPPAQGLFLAFGQRIFGHPAWGVWLSVSLMSAAVMWLCFEWLPPQFALVAGLVALMQVGIVGYWSQSYWGGAVTAIGGALVFGGIRRLARRPRLADGALVGLGVVLLICSRPLEGILLFGTVLTVVVLLGRRYVWPPKAQYLSPGVIFLVILCCGVLFNVYYDSKTTGDLWTPPYLLYEREYGTVSPLLYMSGDRTKVLPNQDFHRLYDGVFRESVERLRQPGIFVLRAVFILIAWTMFFLGPSVILAIQGIRHFRLNHWHILALACCCVIGLHALLTRAAYAHYVASVSPLFYVLFGSAINVRVARRREVSSSLVITILAIPALILVLQGGATVLRGPSSFLELRADVLSRVTQAGGRHLVIVSYTANHDPNRDWVYNGAKMEGSAVLWARDLGEAENEELTRYYSDRKIWHLTVDTEPRAILEGPHGVETRFPKTDAMRNSAFHRGQLDRSWQNQDHH